MKNRAVKISAGIALAIMAGGGPAAAQGHVPGPFMQDQVDAGRKGFADNCAECHGRDLSGGAAPALAGTKFAGTWSNKTTAELYKFIQTTMPVCQGGILANGVYAEIVSFLLWANGAQPGTESFDGKAQANVGSIITGTVRSNLESN